MNWKTWAGILVMVAFLGASCNLDKLLGNEKKPAENPDANPNTGHVVSEPAANENNPAETAAKPSGEALPASFSIAAGPKTYAFNRESDGKWTVTADGKTLSVSVSGGSVTLMDGDQTVASGQLKGDKLKLATPDGRFYLLLKFKADKVKVYLADNSKTYYAFKTKADKIKVVKGEDDVEGETELGKVKYYPENGKLKVKDASDSEVAVCRELTRLTAGPAALLISDLEPEPRAFLMLVLFALNK